jgi:uncharacterized protein (UPF0261 family)
MGGTGGTSLVTHAMQQLPVGVPKLVVSTVASGNTRPYVGAVDVTMMYSVVDVSGVNQMLERTTGVAGFFRASSMERLPTETAITETVQRFKALGPSPGA